MTGYKIFLTQKELQIKMSFLLNVSDDASRKPEEFSLKDIEVLVDNKEQNWFKRAPRGFDARMEKIQVKHQKAIEQKDAALSLLSDDLQDRENQIQPTQCENVGLLGEIRAKNQQIAALQRRYVGHLSNEDKNNSISITTKNNKITEYPHISICP